MRLDEEQFLNNSGRCATNRFTNPRTKTINVDLLLILTYFLTLTQLSKLNHTPKDAHFNVEHCSKKQQAVVLLDLQIRTT